MVAAMGGGDDRDVDEKDDADRSGGGADADGDKCGDHAGYKDDVCVVIVTMVANDPDDDTGSRVYDGNG